MAIASPGFDSFPDTNSNNSAHDLTRRQKNNNNNPSPPANESVAGYVRYCPWCYTNIKVIDNPQNHLDQCNVVVYQPVDTTGTMNQLEAASVAILSVDFKALYSWDQILLNNVTTLNPTPLMSVLWKERLPPLGSVMISPYAMTQEVKATNPEGRLPYVYLFSYLPNYPTISHFLQYYLPCTVRIPCTNYLNALAAIW